MTHESDKSVADQLNASSSAPRRSRLSTRAVVIGVAVALLAGGALWQLVIRGKSADAHTPPEKDPRLTYAGPFQNIHPEVKYVGDAKCAECHEPIAEKFHRHPMGRSIVAAGELDKQLSYDQ